MKNQKSYLKVDLGEAKKKELMDSIAEFYYRETGDDISIILQSNLYDFIMEEFAPPIYNRALDDSKNYLKSRLSDIESDFYTLYKDEK